MIIPNEYYTNEIAVKLTGHEIDTIVNELNAMPHSIFLFLDIQKTIDKLNSRIADDKRLQELKGK